MDKTLLTRDLYDAIMEDASKFKEYWNAHPEEVEEIFRRFSEKFVDVRNIVTRDEKMKHYHNYKCEICTLKTLAESLNYINKSGYKLISVTETSHGSSSCYTLFYDTEPEEN